MVQPAAAFCTQVDSALGAAGPCDKSLVAVTRPAGPTSTSISTLPETSSRSASDFSKQRCTSAPCFCSALSMICAARCASLAGGCAGPANAEAASVTDATTMHPNIASALSCMPVLACAEAR